MMAKVLDVRGSGGQLMIVGESLVLPSGTTTVSTAGSLRFNTVTSTTDFFDGNNWSSFISAKRVGVSNGIASLDGSGKVPLSQVNNTIFGGLTFEGIWDASTNTPPLTSGAGDRGSFYTVSNGGSTPLDGITDWMTGDIAIFDSVKWSKIANLVMPSGISLTPPHHDFSDAIATTKYVKGQGYITVNKTINLTGAISGSGRTDIVTTLATIASGTLLANISNQPAPPVGTSLSWLLDNKFGSAIGSMIYRGTDAWQLLLPGAPDTVLHTVDTGMQWMAMEWKQPVVSVNTRTGKITLNATDITEALGFIPIRSVASMLPDSNGDLDGVVSFNSRNGEITLTATDVTKALGFVPLNVTGLSVGFSGSILSSPYGNGQILTRIAIGFPVSFPRDLPDSTAVCLSAAVNPVSLSILKNGTPIGSIKFDATSLNGRFVFTNDVAFDVGDILELGAPNPADPTFGNITFTFVGYR
jgi:hypothetical protein